MASVEEVDQLDQLDQLDSGMGSSDARSPEVKSILPDDDDDEEASYPALSHSLNPRISSIHYLRSSNDLACPLASSNRSIIVH